MYSHLVIYRNECLTAYTGKKCQDLSKVSKNTQQDLNANHSIRYSDKAALFLRSPALLNVFISRSVLELVNTIPCRTDLRSILSLPAIFFENVN